ncbi:hypothetical protein [Stenotrophomonas tumulicola]|uniref:Uncharacterized protein n=1 Tax=Stenotrophomonas tumulicola TaxID=1685415 RepID=A0A7W3FJ31_9GAMM|nr:hypothetical protein [Stenotrophomonas tumulicola]MBA8680473.1 hypothetical protein [Stenotrophomonas tumulicola]
MAECAEHLLRGRNASGMPAPNQNGVYLDPDEVLTLKGAGRSPTAEIELLHVPGHGWIFATSYCISGYGGGSSPLMLTGTPSGLDREAALLGGLQEVMRRVGGAGSHPSDSPSARRQATEIMDWAASLRAPQCDPSAQLELFA